MESVKRHDKLLASSLSRCASAQKKNKFKSNWEEEKEAKETLGDIFILCNK